MGTIFGETVKVINMCLLLFFKLNMYIRFILNSLILYFFLMSLPRFSSTVIKVSPQSRDFSSNFAVTWWEFGWGCWTEREVFPGKVGVGRVVVDRRKGLLGLWGKRERERHLKVTFWLDDRKRGKGALATGEGLGLDRQAPQGEELPAPCGS